MFGTETDAVVVVAVGAVADETDDVGFAVADVPVDAVGDDAAADQVSCECKPCLQNLVASSEDPCGCEHASVDV